MLYRLRRRMQNEQGFTLIELLVVILIIGILAAVAIPTFLNQRGKGYDANAQSVVKDMQTAAETYATGDNGTYPSSITQLESVDPSLNTNSVVAGSEAITGSGTTADSYTVSATAQSTGDSFSIVETNGAESNLCSSTTSGGGPGGCPSGSTW